MLGLEVQTRIHIMKTDSRFSLEVILYKSDYFLYQNPKFCYKGFIHTVCVYNLCVYV